MRASRFLLAGACVSYVSCVHYVHCVACVAYVPYVACVALAGNPALVFVVISTTMFGIWQHTVEQVGYSKSSTHRKRSLKRAMKQWQNLWLKHYRLYRQYKYMSLTDRRLKSGPKESSCYGTPLLCSTHSPPVTTTIIIQPLPADLVMFRLRRSSASDPSIATHFSAALSVCRLSSVTFVPSPVRQI